MPPACSSGRGDKHKVRGIPGYSPNIPARPSPVQNQHQVTFTQNQHQVTITQNYFLLTKCNRRITSREPLKIDRSLTLTSGNSFLHLTHNNSQHHATTVKHTYIANLRVSKKQFVKTKLRYIQ